MKNNKKINFTKLTQKGISLIVLIVTIIVIIIITATVMLTISKNNPIEMAKEAVFKEDMRTFQDELNMVIAEKYAKNNGKRKEKITALDYTKGNEKNSVYTYLSSFKKKYENKIAIKEDEIVYVGLDEKERAWLLNSGIYMAKKITVHYKDGNGNKLKASEEYPMLDVEYKFEAPEIEGYVVLNEQEEGITSEDIEITFEYCAICNDLAFTGLDASGNETDVESDIVAYTVSGIGECNNPYVAIPREYNGKAVTQIKSSAFRGNNTIKSVVISDTVEKIGEYAFCGCNKLESLTLNAKAAGGWATFGDCSSLKKVKIGGNVEVVGQGGFLMCKSLVDVKLYSEKVKLNSGMFKSCTSLCEVQVNKENNAFKSIDGVVYSKDETIIYMYPSAKPGTTYEIPSKVKEIGICAFEGNTYLIEMNIPSTIEKVGGGAFCGCNKLETLILNAKNAGRWETFGSCSNLKKVEIRENVEILEKGIFYNCPNLTDVTLYSEKAKLNSAMFYSCASLYEVQVNEGNNAFKSVDGVVYSKDGTTIYMYPPAKPGATYEIPVQVKVIGGSAFYNNLYLTEMNIPSTVEQVNGEAFRDCGKLEVLKLNAKNAGDWHSFDCSNLKSVEIGTNVQIIKDGLFRNAKKLISVNYLGTIEMWNNIAIGSKWNVDTSIIEVICTDGSIAL